MKTVILLVLLLSISFGITYAADVPVTTPDGSVIIYKGDLQTTSQTNAFYALYDGINQCRLYIKLADGIFSEGLNELQTSVDVLPGQDIIFPSISLPPSTENTHNLIMQCLGPVQDAKRQVTFSTDIVVFDIEPNITTNINLELYLTKLTVKSVFNNNYVTVGETYQLETVANKVIEITLDPGETAFTLTYDIGDQPKLVSTQSGDLLGNVVYDPTFGNVSTEDLSLNVNNGSMNISAAFIVGDVILSSPGLLVDNLPDSSAESKVYNYIARGLEPDTYKVVVTVDGVEVAYNLDVVVGGGASVPATTGRIDSHIINTLGEAMSLAIDFTTMYDDITAGTLTDPVVRLFLVKGGEI